MPVLFSVSHCATNPALAVHKNLEVCNGRKGFGLDVVRNFRRKEEAAEQ
jgi:hypothetical protein